MSIKGVASQLGDIFHLQAVVAVPRLLDVDDRVKEVLVVRAVQSRKKKVGSLGTLYLIKLKFMQCIGDDNCCDACSRSTVYRQLCIKADFKESRLLLHGKFYMAKPIKYRLTETHI